MAGEWEAQILKLETASYVKNQLQPWRLGIKTNTFRINTIKQTEKRLKNKHILVWPHFFKCNSWVHFIRKKNKGGKEIIQPLLNVTISKNLTRILWPSFVPNRLRKGTWSLPFIAGSKLQFIKTKLINWISKHI